MSDPIFLTSIEGNRQWLDGGAMFGNAPRALWQKWISPDNKGRIALACRSLLIEIGSTKILLETGIGNFFEPQMAERFGVENYNAHLLINSLDQLGIKETDIDFVVLSHLHFDHAGGLMPSYKEKDSQILHFPNAQYIVSKDAFQRAQSPHLRDRASFIPDLQKLLLASGRLKLVTSTTIPELFPEIVSFRFSDGHTPGQMLTTITGKKETFIFAGDLVPGSQWVSNAITMGYDRFPEKIIDEKNDLYSEAIPNQWRLFFTHDNKWACAKVELNPKGKATAIEPLSHLRQYEI